MGQAKRRGTYEERKSNPQGYLAKDVYLTDENLPEFKEKLVNELGEFIYKIQKNFLGPSKPRKKKARRIKTGG